MKQIAVLALSLALIGAGCTPNSQSETPSAPSEASSATEPIVAEPAPAPQPAQEPTPVPTPTPIPTTAPKPAVIPKTTTPTQVSQPVTKTVTVEIKDNIFSPQIAAINPGDTIIWKNVGANNHTVHSLNGALYDSGNLAPGASYSKTFSSQGRYEYYCAYHSGMKGTIIVGTIQAQ